jgi:CheY-like chemotaxis protein
MASSPFQVLVVEDNQNAREILCEMLSILGHGMHCVSTAEEAIEFLQGGQVDVLLADINLPGMSGVELADIAVKSVTGLRIIFASGYGYLVADKTDFEFTLLPKPYGLAQLRHALDHAVPQASSAAH